MCRGRIGSGIGDRVTEGERTEGALGSVVDGGSNTTVTGEEIRVSNRERVKDAPDGNTGVVHTAQFELVGLPVAIVTKVERLHGLSGGVVGSGVAMETIEDRAEIIAFEAVVHGVWNGRADSLPTESGGLKETFGNFDVSRERIVVGGTK